MLARYNVLGQGGDGHGSDLYGVEPWTYYPKNLLLNFNLVAVVAVASLLVRSPPPPPRIVPWVEEYGFFVSLRLAWS
jgi:hypothetical protein